MPGAGQHADHQLFHYSDWSDHRERDAMVSVETVRFDATRANVKVVGELDMATAAPLWAVLRSHMGSGRRFLRLDVSELTFVDATALTGITAIHRDLLAVRGTLVVTGVRAMVGKVLRLTGLDEILFIGGPRTDDDIDTFAGAGSVADAGSVVGSGSDAGD